WIFVDSSSDSSYSLRITNSYSNTLIRCRISKWDRIYKCLPYMTLKRRTVQCNSKRKIATRAVKIIGKLIFDLLSTIWLMNKTGSMQIAVSQLLPRFFYVGWCVVINPNLAFFINGNRQRADR